MKKKFNITNHCGSTYQNHSDISTDIPTSSEKLAILRVSGKLIDSCKGPHSIWSLLVILAAPQTRAVHLSECQMETLGHTENRFPETHNLKACCAHYFFVDLTQARLIWEEETQLKKCLHEISLL